MSSPPSLASPPPAAEEHARRLLIQEKWRQARDELKPLVKVDRVRFLPLLVEANLGLARKMMADGQTDGARQVLNYLATLVPREQLRAVELELATKSGATEQTRPKYVAALVDAGIALPAAERVRLADALVLAFEPVVPDDPASPEQARAVAEVDAVHAALRAVAEAQWPRVTELLRLVPHRSVVSHWAGFIKGIAAFYAGDAARAAKLLRNLPAGSVPARAGAAYLLLADESAAPPVIAPVLEALGGLIGAGGGVASSLLRADQLWRQGNHTESYRVLREAVPAFPGPGLDWIGGLTEFYFKSPHGMAPDAGRRVVMMFDRLFSRGQGKNDTETMLAHRMFSLVGSAIGRGEDLRRDWARFLNQRESIHGRNPRLASLAYGWLGEQLAMTRRAPGFHAGTPTLRDPAGALDALQRSIALDPTNLAAHLQLCALYGVLKKTSERNRLLDDMTARFPDDKQVLLQAAAGCVDRKAYGKGLEYLDRARHVDPLDPRIPEATVTALLRQAMRQFKERRAAKAEQTLARVEEFQTDNPEDFCRSRWTLRLRHGVMQTIWGEAARGAALLAEAAELAPSRMAWLWFSHLAHRVCAQEYRGESPFLAELKAVLRRAPRLGELSLPLRLLAYWRQAPENPRTYEEERLLAAAIERAVGQPFTRAEAVKVVESARDHHEFANAIRKLVKKFLRTDRHDPRFRLWRIEFANPFTFGPPASRAEVQAILDEAGRRHDEPAIREARRLLSDLDHPPPSIPGPFGPWSDFAEGPDDDEEEGFGPDDGLPPPEMTPEMVTQFAELFEELRDAPDAVVRKLRRQTAGLVPDGLFDAMVQMARQGIMPPRPSPRAQPSLPAPGPPPPKPAPRPPPKSLPPPDPNQLNLF